MKRIGVYLTEQQIDRLDQLADATDITVSKHIRKAINEYLSLRAPLITVDTLPAPGWENNVAIGPDSNNVAIPLNNSMPRVITNPIRIGSRHIKPTED